VLWGIALGFGLFLMAMIFHRKLFGTAQSGASSQIQFVVIEDAAGR
jgi:hypothetical protein